MSVFHILNGDCLKDNFPFDMSDNSIIVFREALVYGPLSIVYNQQFLDERALFFLKSNGHEKSEYFEKVVPEFEKLQNIPQDAKIYLWFEDDLFCQVNMWYCLNILNMSKSSYELFWVRPHFEGEYDWKGFGVNSKDDLKSAYEKSEPIGSLQRGIIEDCLKLYISNDVSRIMHYIKSVRSIYKIYPLYAALLKAHLKRFSIPGSLSPLEQNVKEIIASSDGEFASSFKVFSEKYGIYGFGDTQFKTIYDKLISNQNQS